MIRLNTLKSRLAPPALQWPSDNPTQRLIRKGEVTHLLETRARSVRLLQLLQVVVGGDFEARDLLLGCLQTRLEAVRHHREPKYMYYMITVLDQRIKSAWST